MEQALKMKLRVEIESLRVRCPTCGESMQKVTIKNHEVFNCPNLNACQENRLFEIVLSPSPIVEVWASQLQPIFVER
jgi:ssDNA-binding Zn-finger/Zn-ribbon topoisomerase 1